MVLTVPSEYPLLAVGLSAVVSLNFWQQIRVGKARKQYGVDYPFLYASETEVKADPKKNVYNCIQRSHQNTLENLTVVVPLSLFYGLFHPRLATFFLLSFTLGRVGYTIGYSGGNAAKRNNPVTAFNYVGLLGLFFGTAYLGVQTVLALL